MAYVPDLGKDLIREFWYDKTAGRIGGEFHALPSGLSTGQPDGPRYLEFHPNLQLNVVFVVNELSSTVSLPTSTCTTATRYGLAHCLSLTPSASHPTHGRWQCFLSIGSCCLKFLARPNWVYRWTHLKVVRHFDSFNPSRPCRQHFQPR